MCMFFVAINGIVDMVLIPPFSGGNAVVVLECSGKVHLVGIPHCQPNIPDRKTGQLQQLRRFEHAVIQQEFLWRFPQCFLENFAEISAVQSADTGNIFNRDLILKVVFNVGQCLVNVEFPQFAAVFQLFICRRTQKIIQKQIEMPDQMKRRLIFVAEMYSISFAMSCRRLLFLA